MDIPDDIAAAFSHQVTLEFIADLTYRQLSFEAANQGYPGIAAWMRAQADEEITHAHKFADHVLERGGRPQIEAIESPQVGVGLSPLDIFHASLAHEKKVTAAINDLKQTCVAAGDEESIALVDWFLKEQDEEESTVGGIIARIQGADAAGLSALDAELGGRSQE